MLDVKTREILKQQQLNSFEGKFKKK